MKYMEQMKNDILDYIRENEIDTTGDRDELEERLNDELWTEDSVTGNASGSYTMDAYTARDYVIGDGENYVEDMIASFGMEPEEIAKHFFDWEYWDVSIRCYLLPYAITEALDAL